MSRYLVYQFSVADAQQWKSADIAAIIFNLRFWLRKNLANQQNIHDDRVWTYNTTIAWSELFPWLSVPQIKRLLKKLEEGGLLVKGNYNKNKFDKTVWYSLNEPEFYQDQAEEPVVTDSTKSYYRGNDSVQSGVRSRTISTDNKQQIESSSKPADAVFDFDLVFAWILMQFQKSDWYDLDSLDQAFVEAKLEEYQSKYKQPKKGDALSYVDLAMRQRYGIERRSALASVARDNLNRSVVNQLETQATVVDQHTQNMKPRTTHDKLTDRSWADGLNLSEEG